MSVYINTVPVLGLSVHTICIHQLSKYSVVSSYKVRGQIQLGLKFTTLYCTLEKQLSSLKHNIYSCHSYFLPLIQPVVHTCCSPT